MQLQPTDRLSIGIDTVWSEADAGFEPFELMVPPGYLVGKPNQSYDFSRTATYSDLDVSRFEVGVGLRFDAREDLGWRAGYRWIDFDDDAPYLSDTSGAVDFYSLAVVWSF